MQVQGWVLALAGEPRVRARAQGFVEVQGLVLVPGVGLLQLALPELLQAQSLLFSLPLPSFSLLHLKRHY